MSAKNPLEPPADDALFSPKEIAEFIGNAFTASCNPAWGGTPLSEARLAYVRNYAKALIDRLEAVDVATGHLSYCEAVAMLLGAALVLQKLHCKDD